MRNRFRGARAVTLAALAAVLLGGCGATKPYVHDPVAYNRDDPNFAKTPKTRDSVIVCYSKRSTTPAEVARLAAETCAPYGTGIAFFQNNYSQCPMLTPVGAEFLCTGVVGTQAVVGRSGVRRPVGGTPGQPGTPLSGFAEGARPMGVLFGRPGTAAAPAATPAPALPPTPPGQSEAKP
ncbi:MAG: hypothetical protein RLN77_07335 [Rhodospirillales bacterium]